MKKLYLVDVSSMFFRAFYAIPPLRTKAGLPTNALYGFLSMTIKLLRENRPDYMVFCFDRKEPSFRSELYQEYKANRTEMPEDLSPQIPYIRELSEKLGVLCIDKLQFEADDLIGTLAKFGANNNLSVSIVSGDKDFAQLVNEQIVLYDTMKDIRYDHDGVIAKWGVAPDQMIDYLAIVGDTSDNIPGVKGVGPKGAQKLLAEFKTLENIYKNLDKIKSESVRTKFIECKEAAFLAKKLVTIVTDMDLNLSVDDMKLKPIDKENLKKMLELFEFHSLSRKLFDENIDGATNFIKKVNKAQAGQSSNSNKNIKAGEKPLVATGKLNIESLQAELTEQASQVRETSHWSLEELKKNIAPYESVWAVQTERGFCLGYKGKPIQVDASLIEIGKVLSSKKLKWNGFDLKAIWHSLKIENATTPEWDSQLAAYVIKAGDISSFSETYSKYTNKKIADLATVEDFLYYQIELADLLKERLKEVGGYSVLEKLDLPVVPILYSMESRGIKINAEELKAQSLTLNVDIVALEKQIHSLAGESFNISSPKQLGAILFEKLKIPSVKKTKTGFSTGSEVLSKLAPEFSICELVMNYRELTKLKSTYVDAIPQLIDSTDGRIHTRFHQTVTLTGRLSSTNPNLQNIPVRTERGRMIRKAFVAPEGSVLLSVDYSQIELRILAEITGDPGLTKAFLDDVDIHSATAAEVFGIPLKQVNADQRRMAKAVNFGIAYGQGVFGLAETLDIPQNEAKTIIENYFQKFPKVKEYMFDIVNSAKEHGYVETKLGRKRYMDEFKSSNAMIRKFGERAAINSPIQGTASDLMKQAMIEVYQNCSAKMLLQVHDELLFECFEDQVESDAEEISKVMTSVANFKIPLKVNVAWGKNWEDAHA